MKEAKIRYTGPIPKPGIYTVGVHSVVRALDSIIVDMELDGFSWKPFPEEKREKGLWEPTECGEPDVNAPAQEVPAYDKERAIGRFQEDQTVEKMADRFQYVTDRELIKMICRHDVREFKLRRRLEVLEAQSRMKGLLGGYAENRLVDLMQQVEALKLEVAALNEFAVKIVKRMPRQKKSRTRKK